MALVRTEGAGSTSFGAQGWEAAGLGVLLSPGIWRCMESD